MPSKGIYTLVLIEYRKHYPVFTLPYHKQSSDKLLNYIHITEEMKTHTETSMEKDQKKANNLKQISNKKGGLITMPFIIANETFEKVANIGLQVNTVVYLMSEYHYEPANAAIIMNMWSAVSFFMTIFGAFLSDSYLGRFHVIACSTIFELLGQILLWLTAIIQHARPPRCNLYVGTCETPSVGQLLFLVSTFLLMAIGAGGIRPCSLAFAADQIDNPQKPRNKRIMKSFFNWYYVSVVVSIALSVTIIVYIQIKTGWIEGFGITVGLMLFSTVLGHLTLPPKGSGNWYFKDGAKLVEPTDKLRFLNKPCMIRNKASDLASNGMPADPWSLCTVRQVEELKALIKVLPIWSTELLGFNWSEPTHIFCGSSWHNGQTSYLQL
ncbi:protein NRT1/ PTR FAMILY 1.1-like [Neltuma alba]|uniref:protein NRT1/ PTR FAMILY 1.1-like n=1 Tax=Neltuma alba TaxID=207710 RepID=UPI0010A471FC|nr:protein NRT1/ PTR FAMILY 1.1-like [Prosopis alba]